MDIERIEIGRCGCLEDVVIERLGPGLHVFHGTNETGKTTLLEFVRGMLFGFGSLVRRGVIDPKLEATGRLLVRPVSDSRPWTVIRRRAAGTPVSGKQAADDLVLVDDAGHRHSRASLAEWTGGLDEASYLAVMAFGLDELHELSSLQSAGCGNRLYELAGGLDRGQVFRIIRELREAIERLDSDDPTVSPLAALERRARTVRESIEAAAAPARGWGRHVSDHRRLEAELAELEPKLATVTQEEERLLSAMELEPLVREHAAAREALRGFDPDDLVHADHRRWRKLARYRSRSSKLVEARRSARLQAAKEGRSLPKPSLAWQKRRLIRPLLDDGPRLERLTAEAARAETEALLAARRFGEELGSLGLARLVDDDDAAAHRGSLLPAGFTRSFRPLRARGLECAAAAREVREATAVVDEIQRTIDAGGAGRASERAATSGRLAERLEAAATVETLIRKRLAADAQLNDVERSIERLTGDVRDRLEGQLLPAGWLAILGTAFTLGVGLLLSGLLLPREVTGSLAYAMAAIGLAGAGVAGATTWSLDRAAATRLAASRNQLATARHQRQGLLDSLTDLDERLGLDSPAGTTAVQPLEARLALARGEIAQLEAEAAQLAAEGDPAERLRPAETRLEAARRHLARTRGRWKRSLELRGFPGSLTPRTFRELSRHRRHLELLDDERRRAVEDARGLREDLTAVTVPIEQAATAIGIDCERLSAIEQLQLLSQRLGTDQALVRRRRRLRRAYLRARDGHRRAARRLHAVDRRIAELLRRWDVESEEAFLPLVDRRPAHAAAVERLDRAVEAVEAARQGIDEAALDWIDSRLAEASTHPLEHLAERASTARDRLTTLRAELRQRLATVSGIIQTMRSDRSLEPLQSEAAEIDEELAFHRRRRAALETAMAMLADTRQRYLEQHQPPVLLEAATWLDRLTGGRYRRITAVADDAILEIQDADGVLWPPERLSRGTREQVFLALRLALVADLERAGVRLPLIMDDALVNFDDERARLAAETLVAFAAEGRRQMLVLSCHAHVVRLFHNAGAAIRSLAGDLSVAAAPPAPLLQRPPEPAPEPEPQPLPQPVLAPPPPAPRVEPRAAPPPVVTPVVGPGDGIPELPDWLQVQTSPKPVAAVPKAPLPPAASPAVVSRPPMASRPVKTLFIARQTWSAEEFDGELDDRVAVRGLPRVEIPAAHSAMAHDRVVVDSVASLQAAGLPLTSHTAKQMANDAAIETADLQITAMGDEPAIPRSKPPHRPDTRAAGRRSKRRRRREAG